MKLDITGRNVDVTPALREYTEEKLGGLERLAGESIEAHVVLRIDKHRQTAEVQIKSRARVLSGTVETGDLYASIGEVADKLERQLLRQKGKARDQRHRRTPRGGEVAVALTGEEQRVEPKAGSRPRIVLSRRYRIKPMSPEDAVLELEGTEDELLVFREPETYRINVLYRRRDGDYGLVDPEF